MLLRCEVCDLCRRIIVSRLTIKIGVWRGENSVLYLVIEKGHKDNEGSTGGDGGSACAR